MSGVSGIKLEPTWVGVGPRTEGLMAKAAMARDDFSWQVGPTDVVVVYVRL